MNFCAGKQVITTTPTSRSILLIIPLLISLLAVFWVMFAFSSAQASPMLNCEQVTWSVSTEAELGSAIDCYNGQTVGNIYTIVLTQNISLTSNINSINNSMSGILLTVEGNGFAVDGQDTLSIRPFTIENNTAVTFQNITITRGSRGGIYNRGIIAINNSRIRDNSSGEDGGGIYNSGTITISNSIITGNSTDGKGGGIFISFGTMLISNSTISGNSITTNNQAGAGIFSQDSTLTIYNSTISENINAIGGIHNSFSGGGGIYNLRGTVTISSSTINHNLSFGSGGGIRNNDGTVTVRNSIIANSTLGNDCAGQITSNDYNLSSDESCNLSGFNDISNTDPLLGPLQDNGAPTLTHLLFEGSPAIDAGNSTFATDQRGITRPQGNGDDIGSYEWILYDCALQPWVIEKEGDLSHAINCYNLSTVASSYTISLTKGLSLTASTISIDNPTPGVMLVIEGNGYALDGQDIFNVQPINVKENTAVTLKNIIITRGRTYSSSGGGIRNSGTLTISHSTISNNSGEFFGGGGMFNLGTAIINISIISGNFSESNGGGILNHGTLSINESVISNNITNQSGGGIRNSNGIITITNSTFNDNSAVFSGGGFYNSGIATITNTTFYNNSGRNGGGIGSYWDTSTLSLTNSTISGNSSLYNGGGISNGGGSITIITNSTINGNSSINSDGGGIHNYDHEGSLITVNNSIIANNVGDNCTGLLSSNGYNLASDESCNLTGTNDMSGTDPMLGSLEDNGGSTLTHALLEGSPAIDSGSTLLIQDQRSTQRPQGSADDIGAFELVYMTENFLFLPLILISGVEN